MCHHRRWEKVLFYQASDAYLVVKKKKKERNLENNSMSINRKDHSSININNVYKGPRTHTHTHTYIGHKLQMLKGEK